MSLRSICLRPAFPGVWPHPVPGVRLRSAIGVAVVLAYVPLFRIVLERSISNPYAGHVPIVPIFVAMLLWVDHRRFRNPGGRSAAAGVGIVAVALIMLAIAYGVESLVLQVLSFIAAVAGLVWCWDGLSGVRRAVFALAFLPFMIPPPREALAAIAPALQHLVAVVTASVLEALQIPVQQQGVFLRLPGLRLEVAEECAGLRFLFILFVCIAAFARIVLPTISGQLALMALSIPVALLANIARVTATTLGAYTIGPHVVTGPAHHYIGKGFWGLAVIAMIGIATILRARAIRMTPHHSRAACALNSLRAVAGRIVT